MKIMGSTKKKINLKNNNSFQKTAKACLVFVLENLIQNSKKKLGVKKEINMAFWGLKYGKGDVFLLL